MYEYNCKIVRVVDGDTVDVDIDLGFGVWMRNERVRLYGIDAPESRTSDKEEKKYGLASKKFVQDTMPLDSTQTLRTMKDDRSLSLSTHTVTHTVGALNPWQVRDYASWMCTAGSTSCVTPEAVTVSGSALRLRTDYHPIAVHPHQVRGLCLSVCLSVCLSASVPLPSPELPCSPVAEC